jgi:hypothetical protein
MAVAAVLSCSSVQRIWQAQERKPHLLKTFKLSNRKRFVEKVHSILGLCLDPSDKALMFLKDKNSHIQARSPIQPGLPFKKGPDDIAMPHL